MIISVIILLMALSVIVIKVSKKPSAVNADQKTTAGKSSCCDTTAAKDSTAKPCCPKN